MSKGSIFITALATAANFTMPPYRESYKRSSPGAIRARKISPVRRKMGRRKGRGRAGEGRKRREQKSRRRTVVFSIEIFKRTLRAKLG